MKKVYQIIFIFSLLSAIFLEKWLTSAVEFNHIIRDQNFDIFKYGRSIIVFTAKTAF